MAFTAILAIVFSGSRLYRRKKQAAVDLVPMMGCRQYVGRAIAFAFAILIAENGSQRLAEILFTLEENIVSQDLSRRYASTLYLRYHSFTPSRFTPAAVVAIGQES